MADMATSTLDRVSTGVMDAPLGTPSRPSWRGRLHLISLYWAVPALVLLAMRAEGARARAGVIVYAVGLCSMLAVSTTYHRWVHTLRSRRIWRSADHAVIFAAIGGTFTPLCLIALGTGWAIALLITVWAAAALGALMKIVRWRHAERVGPIMYIGIGWAGTLLVPSIWRSAGIAPVLLMLFGGLAYTIGAVGFGRQWPKLRPSVFGYHEVWHAFTVAAAAAQLAAVWIVATN
jgi:hemolysin III